MPLLLCHCPEQPVPTLYHLFSEEMSSFAFLFWSWAKPGKKPGKEVILLLCPCACLQGHCSLQFWPHITANSGSNPFCDWTHDRNGLFKSLWTGRTSPGCCLRLLAHPALLGQPSLGLRHCSDTSPVSKELLFATIPWASQVFCPRSSSLQLQQPPGSWGNWHVLCLTWGCALICISGCESLKDLRSPEVSGVLVFNYHFYYQPNS